MSSDAAPCTSHRLHAKSGRVRLMSPEHDRRLGLACWDIIDEHGRPFTLHVANTAELRKRAFCLAGSVYARQGYGDDGPLCSAFDTHPDTFTLLATAADGTDAGTITLYFDSPAGMPSEAIYHDCLGRLRAQQRRLVEVARLAIDEACMRSRLLLVALFQGISLYARRITDRTDLIIEVNPRHVSFYKHALGFTVIGEARPCPRVRGAPAVLLRLDLADQERLIAGMEDPDTRARTRLLYASYLPMAEEPSIAGLFAREHRPMSPGEARALGLMRHTQA